MDIKEIEKAASQGAVLDGLNPAELMLYNTLAAVYDRFRLGTISKEQGSLMKNQAITAYKRMSAEYEQFKEICAEYQKKLREGYNGNLREN